MPWRYARFGDVNSPANTYVGMDFMAKTAEEVKIPNVVTAVLASYRGYDTFGEVVVIFSAGLGVLLLLGPERKLRTLGCPTERTSDQ